ncbi:MAG TPA: phosphatidylglycerophosphatase A [Polyangiaceae bacterium]|nr:phosphatidylglycerophosphatase A [Polyangiaceae bacterium]
MKAVDRVAFALGTWFGFGLSPIAPGTCGAIGAIPLHFLFARWSLPLHALAIGVLSLVGIWASHRVATVTGEKDPQIVVIDEVAGVLIAMAAVREFGTWPLVLAFLLFRAFDITKPGPIRKAEHLPPVGFGVMADDLLAGVVAALVARGAVMISASL